MSTINHPNVITIHETGKSQGIRFLATEFVCGETLRHLCRGGTASIEHILEIAIQIARALVAIHKSGIVHGDIKPDNIMIRPDGIVKVLDFGLARLQSQSLEERVTAKLSILSSCLRVPFGTPSYMSPEQAKGEAVDGRTDLFSFGVVLYELLSGKNPFHHSSLNESIASILKTQPRRLCEVVPEVPASLDVVVMRALEKEKGERYETAREMLVALRHLRQQLSLR